MPAKKPNSKREKAGATKDKNLQFRSFVAEFPDELHGQPHVGGSCVYVNDRSSGAEHHFTCHVELNVPCKWVVLKYQN